VNAVVFPNFPLHLRTFDNCVLHFVMAVIQKIRDKYAKLAGGVIVVALLGFIFTDLGKSGPSRSTTIGKINGEKIDVKEYEAAIAQREAETKRQNPNATLDDNTQAQLRDQAWNQLVSDKLMGAVDEKLGITVTKAELNDMLTGPNPDPNVKQAFTNPQTGVFNPMEVKAQIAQIKKTPEGKQQWDAFEDDLVKRRYAAKFNALVSGAIYTPKFVLDDLNASRNSVAKIGYVKLPYTLIPDASVKVSDDEIKKYMDNHKTMFTIKEPTRGIEYVSFSIVPSKEDSAAAFAQLDKIKTEFATATDDEAFANRNSQNQIPIAYYTKQQLQSLPNVDELMGAPVGSIVGPFYDGNNFVLAKIKETKSLPDSVTVRHILVATQAAQGQVALSDSAAKLRIDSVVAMVKGGVSFDTLAARYSDDQGSKNNGGKYDFPLAQKSTLAKEFGDFIFDGHAGETKVVKTEFGYHYIEILKQGTPTNTSKIAFVSKPLNVSDNTNNALYTKASSFAGQAKNAAAFDKLAKASGYTPAPADGLNKNSFVVNGIGSSRDLVKWAYDAKIGDVSPVYTINNKYIIAKLSSVMDAGLAPINDKTRPILTDYVRKQKKAQMLMDKTKGQSTLEAIAQSQGQAVGVADSVNFVQAFVPGLGNEPKVAGYAFFKGFKENTLSKAIPGQEGVYYINLQSRTVMPEAGPRNIAIERQMADYQIKGNAANMVVNGLREAAEVKDTRSELY
jgi:peptidyl-prolyl cis-trans isomerase D